MKATLRQRQKGDKIHLYIDYYGNGERHTENLKMHLIPEPLSRKLTKQEKDANRSVLELAKRIEIKRNADLMSGKFGLDNLTKLKSSFINYFKGLKEKRKTSKGNYDNWDSALKHIINFTKMRDVTFEEANHKWLEKFKEYLQHEARTPNGKPLSQNSQSSYFNKVRATFNQAKKEGIIVDNPVDRVSCISQGDTEREFLTQEELQILVHTECENQILKNAFLFSALTGLRWSDVQKLVWGQLMYSENEGHYLRFTQQKTKRAETLHIPEQVLLLLGERRDSEEKLFPYLKYSAWHNLKLREWVLRAGISKTITFHCARHTYATMLLTNGNDLYTVSKMLGHKNIKTTQVYGRIIDSKKREAANSIRIQI